MDIDKLRKYTQEKIEAGESIRLARQIIKNEQHQKQDVYEGIAEKFKPLLDKQESIKEAIDEKQNKLINQLQDNQTKIVQAIEYDPNKALTYGRKELPKLTWDLEDDLGDDIEDVEDDVEEVAKQKETIKPKIYDIDKGIDKEYNYIIETMGYPKPSDFIHNKELSVDKTISKVKNKIKRSEGYIHDKSTKQGKPLKDLSKISMTAYKRNTQELPYYKDYLDRLEHIKKSDKFKGEGIYNQPKRNAYKLQEDGGYGNLIIDMPKLIGQLHLSAFKNGQEVYNKKVDFDTIDLLTKRFNSKKNYSALSKKVFDELNQLSEIPIHKTSKKFSKIGKGIMYYNNIDDLSDRLFLLGGEILAGNNNIGVKNEFSTIAHKLRDLGNITDNKLDQLIRKFIM